MTVGGTVGYVTLGSFRGSLHGHLVHGFQSLFKGLEEFLEVLPEDYYGTAIEGFSLGRLAFHDGQEKIAHPVFLHIEEITTAFAHYSTGKYFAQIGRAHV